VSPDANRDNGMVVPIRANVQPRQTASPYETSALIVAFVWHLGIRLILLAFIAVAAYKVLWLPI
jgi:hypothetical protein